MRKRKCQSRISRIFSPRRKSTFVREGGAPRRPLILRLKGPGPSRTPLLARSGRSVAADGGHPVPGTIELLRHFYALGGDFFNYSDPVRLTPIQSDSVRLGREPMGRFGAFGAAAPRGRIELLRHFSFQLSALSFCSAMSKNRALTRHSITHYHVLTLMPAK
jgi:hypothetical protein